MTEEGARDWVRSTFGTRVYATLDRFAALLALGAAEQNLVARSTLEVIWNRHLADSAQLILHAPASARSWIDIGSGAGLPGIVTGAIFPGLTYLIEPRARRCDFLNTAISDLGLASNVKVVKAKVPVTALDPADVISARAVSSTADLIDMTGSLRHSATTLILPRGRSGQSEFDQARKRYRGLFHVEQSRTDESSIIIVASGVTACSA